MAQYHFPENYTLFWTENFDIRLKTDKSVSLSIYTHAMNADAKSRSC